MKSPGFYGWIIILLSILVVVFLVSMFIPRSEVVVTRPTPGIIRLQLQNGCGIGGAADETGRALEAFSPDMVFDIIDKSNAEVYNFEKTLVIDRKGATDQVGVYSPAATYVADLLKVGPEQRLIQKFDDNLLDIDVTVIIGADYKAILSRIGK